MNIFKILSSGNASIKEPNVSAFLYFLLDPLEIHGFNDSFLQGFLKALLLSDKELYKDLIKDNKEVRDLSKQSKFDVKILIEKEVEVLNTSSKNKSRFIDIVIEIFDTNKDTQVPKYVFAVENKINDGASSDDMQLIDTQKGLEGLYTDSILSIIFLTKDYSNKSKSFFKNYKNDKIKSIHYVWQKIENEPCSIFYILQGLLEKEIYGEIEPLNEYFKFTIKSFMNFVCTDFKSYKIEQEESNSKRELITSEDYFNKWKHIPNLEEF